MKTKDRRRKWMWIFLVVLAALQLYAVRELLAAFALFALGFLALALFVATFYFFQKVWEAGLKWASTSYTPALTVMRRAVATIEDWGRRPPIRRPDSEPAS